MRKALIVSVGLAMVWLLAPAANSGDGDPVIEVEDPGCYLDSFYSRCYDVAVDLHRCEAGAIFEHYDGLGHPLPVTGKVTQKCYVVNYLLPFIKVPCTASDTDTGWGSVRIDVDCLIHYGTDYGVCWVSSGYPRFRCYDW